MGLSVALRDQIDRAQDDQMRVLVVGAGVAGVTFSELLRARGQHPVLIERAGAGAGQGYMLGLLPIVHPVMDKLGVRDRYLAESVPVSRYLVRDRRGRRLKEYDLDGISAGEGGYRGITRGALLDLLSGPDAPTYGTTVTGLDQPPEAVQVRLSGQGDNAVEADFDLVVVADGLNSRTRRLLLDPDEVTGVSTGFAGWVGWLEQDSAPYGYEEFWGCGLFVGTYPVPRKLGVFVGGDQQDQSEGCEAFIANALRRKPWLPPLSARALRAVSNGDTKPYLWPLEDRRAERWATGRAVLLGDAAVGFLPTAGVGAAMAMESAGVLAAAIADARPHEVPRRLAAYEKTHRRRVETAQQESRRLAGLMFRRSQLVAALRDATVRAVPERVAMDPLRRLVRDRPAV